MEIIDNSNHKIAIYDLDAGDVFEASGQIFMKISTITCDGRNINAIDLSNGALISLTPSTPVCVRECELVLQ